MNAFLYAMALQWKLDIRSKTLLITCYIVPLLFFAFMGSIFTSILPDAKNTLIQSMTVFGVTMGALIGLPPSLVEIYGGSVQNVYKANGVPISIGVILTNCSAFIHLFTMGSILFVAAPIIFGAQLPANPWMHFIILALLIGVSLSVASVIGLLVKDPSKTAMFSIIVFLPSVILSGIMFSNTLLPNAFQVIGMLFPATWGYRLMTEEVFRFENLLPLFLIWAAAAFLCALLLKRADMRR